MPWWKNNYWIQATTIHKREVKRRRKSCPSPPRNPFSCILLPSSKLSFEEMLLDHRSEHGFIPKSLSRPEKGVLLPTAVSGVITLELKIGLLILVLTRSHPTPQRRSPWYCATCTCSSQHWPPAAAVAALTATTRNHHLASSLSRFSIFWWLSSVV